MGVIELKYKNMNQSEDIGGYLDQYNNKLSKIKNGLSEVVDLASVVLPRAEQIACGGLYHIGWYISDTFIPDYIPGLADEKKRNWIFLVPEKYRNEPVLVCAFKDNGSERVFREYFEINLNPRKPGDPPPELNLEQLIKVEQGLKDFLTNLFH